MLAAAAQAHGSRLVALRYLNATDADPFGETGESSHERETPLIPNVVRTASGHGNSALKVLGGDYPMRDGACARDYVHVNDLIESAWRWHRHLLY